MTIQIVVVDDDEVDRYLVQRVIKSLDIDAKVTEFVDGEPFVEVLCDDERRLAEIGPTPPPILVLLDINMPRMGGFEVLNELKRETLEKDVVMFVTMYSSSTHAEDRSDALKFDFVKDYFVKPVTAEKLNGVIESLYNRADFEDSP